MNPSKLYIPNPQKWVTFYKHVAEGRTKLSPTNQTGGAKTSRSFIVPVDKFISQSEYSTSKNPTVKLVSTTEQMVDQAKSELERDGEDLKALSQAVRGHKRKRSRSRKNSKPKRVKKHKVRKLKVKSNRSSQAKKVRKTLKVPKRSRQGKSATNKKRGRKRKKVIQQRRHNFIPKDIFDH